MTTISQGEREALSQDILLSIPKYMHKSIFKAFAHHRQQAYAQAIQDAARVVDICVKGYSRPPVGLINGACVEALEISATAIRSLLHGGGEG